MTVLALTAAIQAAAPVQAAEASWPDALATSLAHLDRPSSVSLPQAMSPAITFARGPCGPANLPSEASEAPVVAAVLVYDDESSCDKPTSLVFMQLYIEGRAVGDVSRFKLALSRQLPAPCFAGSQPSDPRRRAPAHAMLAWRLEGRLVTLGQDEGDGSAAAVSVLETTPPATGRSKAHQALVDQFVASMPEPCR